MTNEPTHVPPEWPGRKVRIAFVGEAPGNDETAIANPRPLIGPSGRVYNMLLRGVNLDRKDVLTTNVFDQRLPDNDVANWCDNTSTARAGGYDDLPPIGGAGFLRPEFRWHLERLASEIEAADPDLIVPLGGTALWAFTGDAGIKLRRGSIQPATLTCAGRKLLPTYHPSAVLQDWGLYIPTMMDFIQIAAESTKGPAIRYPKRELILRPTLDEMRDYGDAINSSTLLSVDIERWFGQMTMIGFAPDAEHAIVVPFWDKTQPNRSYWKTAEEETEALMIVKEWCESPVPKVGHWGGGYDAFILWNDYGIALRNYTDDTMLMHHVLYPELAKDLGSLGANYGTQGPWKTMRPGGEKKKDD